MDSKLIFSSADSICSANLVVTTCLEHVNGTQLLGFSPPDWRPTSGLGVLTDASGIVEPRVIATIFNNPGDEFSFRSKTVENLFVWKQGVFPLLETKLSQNGNLAKFSYKPDVFLDQFVPVISCLKRVGREPGLSDCIAPPTPVLPEPVADLESCLLEESGLSQRLAAVYLGGPSNLGKDLLSVHCSCRGIVAQKRFGLNQVCRSSGYVLISISSSEASAGGPHLFA